MSWGGPQCNVGARAGSDRRATRVAGRTARAPARRRRRSRSVPGEEPEGLGRVSDGPVRPSRGRRAGLRPRRRLLQRCRRPDDRHTAGPRPPRRAGLRLDARDGHRRPPNADAALDRPVRRVGLGQELFMGLLRREVDDACRGRAAQDVPGTSRQIEFNAWHYADTTCGRASATRSSSSLRGPDPTVAQQRAALRDELAEALKPREVLEGGDRARRRLEIAELRAELDEAAPAARDSARALAVVPPACRARASTPHLAAARRLATRPSRIGGSPTSYAAASASSTRCARCRGRRG